ncbi:MAG TPA: hypothetical protein VGH84_06620, partial [Steroidobacteraceae bacterium]
VTTSRQMPPIVVIDSIMGAGKTTHIIDHMNATHAQGLADFLASDGKTQLPKFLYVTPLLDRTLTAFLEKLLKDLVFSHLDSHVI